jgi:hypothetical protein
MTSLAARAPLFCAFVALLLAPLPGQRAIRQVSSLLEVHDRAKISPDGQLVAFLGAGKIGVVPFIGGAEATLVSSASISGFLWANNSSGVYYLDGTTARFVARTGGTPQTIGTVTGAQAIWDVDATDATLYGTRFDGASQRTHVFTLATNGASAFKDLFNSLAVFDELRLDPSGAKLLYRESAPQPFQPREYFAYDLVSKQATSLTGGGLNGEPSGAHWIDNGQSIAFWLIDPTSNRWQIARVGPSSTNLDLLTQGQLRHRYSVIDRTGKWIVCESQHPAGGTSPAVLPLAGGGLVQIEPEQDSYNIGSGISIDAAGQRIAFSAKIASNVHTHVFAVSLDREIVISPRAEIGQTFRIEMPLATTNEAGAVFIAAGLLPAPFPFGGLVYGFALDPTIMLQIGARGAGQGNVIVNVPVPNDPTIPGNSVFVQGIRLVNSQLQGDFTRWVEVSVF